MPLETAKPLKADLYRKSTCRYCETKLPESFVDLGTMALANSFLKPESHREEEFVCPLRLTWCSTCGLVQLSDVVPAERMFSNYLYVSSTTQTFRKHFAEYARSAKARLLRQIGTGLAVDIGSNDGLLLSCYQNEGLRAVGIEPAKNLSQEANAKGLATLNDYFGENSVETVLKNWGAADIISANNVFAHINDIQGVLRNVDRLLRPDGIFIIEFPYLVAMVEEMLFDMIYHEHLSYIALHPLRYVLSRFEMEIFAVEEVASHGGSLRAYIQKKNAGHTPSPEVGRLLQREIEKGYNTFPIYQEFTRRVYEVRETLKGFVAEIKKSGKTLSGYGAPAKGNTLINFCRFDSRQFEYIVDDNPLKQNRLTPGAHIPVVSSQHLLTHPTDYVFIFAWNFAEEIIKKLWGLKQEGVQFIIPLPKPRRL